MAVAMAATSTGTAYAGEKKAYASAQVAAAPTTSLVIRARATLAGQSGAAVTLRVNNVNVGSVEVKSASPTDYSFRVPALKAGDRVDIVYTNDGNEGGVDRNLYITQVASGNSIVEPTAPGSLFDRGSGPAAFDGIDTMPAQGDIFWNGALRLVWPAAAVADSDRSSKEQAVRFLQSATFGATDADVEQLASGRFAAWISDQRAVPYAPDFLNHVQAKFALGDSYWPKGANYDPMWVSQKFWERGVNAPDQLRKRVAFALHKIFVVSQVDSGLWWHARGMANYLDLLNKHAFGNYRNLLQDMALSPMMGIYLTHRGNGAEEVSSGRMPDENFAREIMQLFSIGLYELNPDGTPILDASGKPIETYSIADVTAMAKVFTGFSWGFPDSELTDQNFKLVTPPMTRSNDPQVDIKPMKAYPGKHSTQEKRLFAGKRWETLLPAGNSATVDLRTTLDVLFNHPNVGPFIGRQLIQNLTTSNPSPAYVARVAKVFADNGQGVRGDLGAVVRAILLDTEARQTPASDFGKLKEPLLRVTQWMRACGASSSSGAFMLSGELDNQGERALHPPSVFSYYRPGYVPPNSSFALRNATAPEFQVVNETSVANWINMAEAMVGSGIGWTGSKADVSCSYQSEAALATSGALTALPDRLNLMLLGGRMSPTLRQAILDTLAGVPRTDPNQAKNRALAATFLTLASPEFMFQP